MSSKWRKCVFGCESFRSLFSLPREEPSRQKWEEFISGSARHSGQLFVCDRHFREDCLANLGPYRSGLSGRLQLQPGAVPTIRPEQEAGKPPGPAGTQEEAQKDPETLRKPEPVPCEEPQLKRIKEEEADVPLAEQDGSLKQENGGFLLLPVSAEGARDSREEAVDGQRHLLDDSGKPADAQIGVGVKSEPPWSCSPDQSHTESLEVKEEEGAWSSQDEHEDEEEQPHSCSSPTRLHRDRPAGADVLKAADVQTVDSSEGAHRGCSRAWYRSFNTTDDWKLITEVQDRPILYDTLHLFYKDNDTKDRAWAEVALAVGADADVCQKRWRVLRDQFVKNRRKRSGSAGGVQRGWKYADTMSFLSPYIHLRSPRGYMRPAGSLDREAAENSEEGPRDTASPVPPAPLRPATPARPAAPAAAVRQSRSRSPREKPNPRQHTGKKRTAIASLEDRLISILQEPPPTPAVPRGQEDEAYHFALSLVPRMAGLTRDGLDRLKIEFLRILQRVEAEERTRPHTTPKTP